MTTLSANTGVTLTVGATDMLLIDCPSGGRARVEAISGVAGASTKKILVEHRGARRKYGPFGVGTISLGALEEDLRYSLGANPQLPDAGNLRYQSNDDGSVDVLGPDDQIIGLSEVTDYVNLTATGTAFTGACEFAGYVCTVAAGNITVYDNTSAAGTVIVPTTALTVGAFPIFGAGTNGKMALTTGCHVVLSGAATVNVLVG